MVFVYSQFINILTIEYDIIYLMITVFTLYFFLLGIIIGSFLNVLILRYNTGRTIGGRSACMSCKTKLTWKELIPIFSFLFQKGRCKTCKTKLSIQYILVELIMGLLFAGNFLFIFTKTDTVFEFIGVTGLTSCILACMLVIFVYDLKHKIIPDLFSFTAFGLSILLICFLSPYILISRILAAGLFYFSVWIIWKLSKGRMIGLGDAKLLLSIGMILGFVYGLSAIFIAAWLGAAYVVYLLLKVRLSKTHKHITMKTEIPFGPFLILGFLIVYFTHIDVTNITFLLENFS